MALRIVLLGGPGAGKGTQANRLCEAYKLPHVASGDIFREHVAKGTELGRQISRALDDGQLVSDELASTVVFDRLSQPDCAAGYVLDGFPRSMPQARALDTWLAGRGEQLDAVIELDVADEEVVERILARRQCPVCGAIYNLRFDAPAEDQRCERPGCTGQLVQRADDNETTIRERLRVYRKTTKPLIEYYEEQGMLRRIPGDTLGPDAVYQKIEDVLATLGVA